MRSDAPVRLLCTRCGSSRTVAAFDPARSYRCPERDCGGDLVDPGEAKTVRSDSPSEVARAADDPRNVLGKYVLLRELGRGGMGAVYKAWDTSLKRWVAIKFLLLPGNDEDLRRFQREAQTAAALKHPGIASIYEIGEIDKKPYIAMEYVEGRNLHGLKLKVSRACEVVRQVAIAVEVAHQQSIIHRDLKPGNVILGAKDKVTVLDFGLAKSLNETAPLTVSGTAMGTPSYMSPEQAQGNSAAIGPRSDVYQLGAILYELVTGRPPFRGNSAAEILRRVVDEDLISPSRIASLPADVETMILRAMEKDPARRYPSAKALAGDLERFQGGRGILARRDSTFTRMKRVVRRHKPAVALAAGALLLALAGIAWSFQRSSTCGEHVRDADAAFLKGEDQKALELYSRALELGGDDPHVQQRLDACRARLKLAQEKLRSAEEARLRAEKAAAGERARSSLREAARPAYERGLGELEEAVKDLYRQGADLVKTRGRLVSAVEAFGESLAKWPDNPDALYARGRARALRFEFDEADRDLARAIDLRPDFAAARADRAKLLLQRYIEARMQLGWTWSENVARPFTRWKDLAKGVSGDETWSAFAEDKMPECRRLCEQRLKDKREQEEVWKLRGDTYFMSAGAVSDGAPSSEQDGQLRSAIESYSEAIRLRPNYYEARMMRGYVRKKRGDIEPALEDVGVALALRPDDALACCLMARCSGSPGKSLEWFDRGLRSNPNSFICRVGRAAALLMLNRIDEARPEIDRATALNPDHFYPLYLRGVLRLRSADAEGAFQDLKRAVELEPRFPSCWFHFGSAAYATRRWHAAIEAEEQALRLGYAERASCEEILRKARQQAGN
jgi:serine/threonine-protein kinase